MAGPLRKERRRTPYAIRDDGGVKRRKHRPDYLLLIFSLALLVVGLIVVYSISPALGARFNVGDSYFAGRQIISIFIGLVAFLGASLVPIDKWRKLGIPLLIVGGLATIVTLFLPVSSEYPAPRWIRIGGLSLQSVEIVKLAFIVWLASFIEKRIDYKQVGLFNKPFRPAIAVSGVFMVVVALIQSDFGSAAVLAAIMGSMFFVAGLPMREVLQAGLIVGVVAVLFILPFGYRRDRLNTFLNPEADCVNTGYQACQAFIAVGSGGIAGRGLASSGQAYGYLPEAANDSIFAIIAEKFGFIGSSLVVVLITAFFVRIKNIMERAPDEFTRLMATGVLAWLSLQTFINIGAMIGLLPLKGITLPLISYGGTSVVFVMAAVGLVFNISRYTSYAVNRGEGPKSGSNSYREGKRNENIAVRRRDRRTHQSATGRRS